MALNFPNPSRFFDEARHTVRFVGHDGLFEIPFSVEAGALGESPAAKSAGSEGRCLTAFDKLRPSIYDAARAAYSNTRRKTYTLSAADIR